MHTKAMISVSEPKLGDLELEYVVDCVRTGWISSAGKYLGEFEDAWARYCGRRYGVSVSSGTAALHVGVACLGLEEGDEVIMPTFTIVSCASAVLAAGAVPKLVDCDPRTWCLDVGQLEGRITPRTRAIMPVHIYGHPVEMDPVLDLAEVHGLAVIEDTAEAHGAQYRSQRGGDDGWRRCGSFGELSCFSFYANKLVTTGEGGMIVTDDEAIAGRAQSLRNLCFQPGRRFYHDELGFNYRMTNLQAALGLAQLRRIDNIVERKRQLGARYTSGLVDVAGLELPVEESWARNVYWMYGVVVDAETGLDAVELATRLTRLGIETRPFFLGMHEQPVFRRLGLFRDERYPVAERLSRQGLYLPSGLGLTDRQIDDICDAVREAME